ncbi:MAG TPA: hypothetical protein VIF14_07535 [Alphaproteobacteria bacterium]|jgi:hypothetical protein
MRSFLDIKEGEKVAFRLSRAEWDALPYIDQAMSPQHCDLFKDRERFGVVYRWLGSPRCGSWWMACIAIDDGLQTEPSVAHDRPKRFLRSALTALRRGA